jgi:hypothetical protein
VRRSRVGSRAAEAAAERATALRTLSVLGVTGALALAIFAGVGIASPMLAHAALPHQAATARASQVCPETGCTASTCHGTTHADPNVFYARKKTAATAPAKKKPRVAVASAKSSTRVASKSSTPRKAPAAPKPRVVASKPAVRAAPKRTVLTCPQTGCTASSCHGAHHQSASSYYK